MVANEVVGPIFVCVVRICLKKPEGEMLQTNFHLREIIASQPGHEKVAWYRLFAHARNICYIFRKIVLSTSCHLNTEYYK